MKEYSELVNRYKKFRKLNRKLHSILTHKVSKKAIQECGRKLGIMKGDTFVFRDMDETAVLMDYCIYDYYENSQGGCPLAGSNAVSRYIAESPPVPGSDEYVVLKAMSESFYTLVQVEHVAEGVGAQADDLLGDRSFLIIDMGLGKTAVKGLVIATRLLPFEDFTMTSGAALPVDPEIVEEIFPRTKKPTSLRSVFGAGIIQQFGSEDAGNFKLKTLNLKLLDMQQRADLMTTIIRLCLGEEGSFKFKALSLKFPNEPCPCGSGKKYKRCCGRMI